MSQHDNNKKKIVNFDPYKIDSGIDVEFSEEYADAEDWEALERSERADARQQNGKVRL